MSTRLRLTCVLPVLAGLMVMSSCASYPPGPRDPVGHIMTTDPAPAPIPDIPSPVTQAPILPEPEPVAPVETYTVVVNEVPVKELLFALARDAAINVDIHPSIEGTVTLNAIDQTLNQILDRISRQIDLRYEMKDGVLVIGPDLPYLKSYEIDYVNMARDTTTDVKTSTQVSTGDGDGGGIGSGNTSDSSVSNVSTHRLWERIAGNILLILGESVEGGDTGEMPQSNSVIVNAESGVITVRATTKQHGEIQAYLDLVMANALRQVMIEATIVEVVLNDKYQAGIDWAKLAEGAGFTIAQVLLGGFEAAAGGLTQGLFLQYKDADLTDDRSIDVTVKLLQEFGDTRVLSSPKLMTLNNQTAVLKVVDNEVYFTLELQEDENENGTTDTTITSTVNTVAVGVIMNVTPQINDVDTVTLNVRPTISRIREFVADPGATIIASSVGESGVTSLVPVVQVRETETVLKAGSGQIAVIGGLMQDAAARDTDQVPAAGDIDTLGEAFKFHDNTYRKSELVVFLRPWVIKNPDIEADFRGYQPLLPEKVYLPEEEPLRTLPQETHQP